jgi:hypothetical protein
MSAEVRCGYVAANKTLIGPPSEMPKNAARSGANRVHHRSHVVHALLDVGMAARRSDIPVPGLSKMIRRENEASRRIMRASAGFCH